MPPYKRGYVTDEFPTDNLNMLVGNVAENAAETPRAAGSLCRNATVHFDFVEMHCASFIEKYPVVIGCVAWLTSSPILDALKSREGASIIVQKEDFLRPDPGGLSLNSLRPKYDAVPGITRFEFAHAGNLSYCAGPDVEGVRCAGIRPGDRARAFPRMHHKFIVGGRMRPDTFDDAEATPCETFEPEAVWTGSFNFTRNASRSLENAIVIDSPDVALAFLREWVFVLALSEPLDWESEYVAPEWRWGS